MSRHILTLNSVSCDNLCLCQMRIALFCLTRTSIGISYETKKTHVYLFRGYRITLRRKNIHESHYLRFARLFREHNQYVDKPRVHANYSLMDFKLPDKYYQIDTHMSMEFFCQVSEQPSFAAQTLVPTAPANCSSVLKQVFP